MGGFSTVGKPSYLIEQWVNSTVFSLKTRFTHSFQFFHPPSEVWPLLWHYSTHVFPSYIAYIIYNVCISYVITQFCSLSPATILWKPESRFYHLLTFGTTLQDTPNSQFTNIAWKSSIWDDDMTLQGNRPQNFNRSFLTRCLVKTSRNTRDFLGRGRHLSPSQPPRNPLGFFTRQRF